MLNLKVEHSKVVPRFTSIITYNTALNNSSESKQIPWKHQLCDSNQLDKRTDAHFIRVYQGRVWLTVPEPRVSAVSSHRYPFLSRRCIKSSCWLGAGLFLLLLLVSGEESHCGIYMALICLRKRWGVWIEAINFYWAIADHGGVCRSRVYSYFLILSCWWSHQEIWVNFPWLCTFVLFLMDSSFFCLPIFPNICTIVNLVKLTRVSCHRSYDILARDISKFAVVYLSLYIAFSFAINYLNQAYVQYATAVDSSLMPSNYTSGCPNQIQTFSDVVYELFTMAFGDNLSGTLDLARGPPCGGLEVILNLFSCVAVCDQAWN